ncbi:MAG TPA: ankyrin repeat domain-containing protein [Gammaproteobacteria bacterium]|nr:ankyrin repeat domain-containing protein [Gammaproteobacteria bacterium]
MSSESKESKNFGIGIRTKKSTHESNTSFPTSVTSDDEDEIEIPLNSDQARAAAYRMECESKAQGPISGFTPIQETIDDILTQPAQTPEATPFDPRSLTTTQLRTAFFTKLQKTAAQEPFSGFTLIQDSIDKLVASPKEKVRRHTLIDYLDFSSLLLKIINFAELSWLQFPPVLVGAAEIGHSEPESTYTSVKKPLSNSASQGKKASPSFTSPNPSNFPTLPFGTYKTEKGFLKAIKQKNLEKVLRYLEKTDLRARLNVPDQAGYPPIFRAIESGEDEILKNLLQAGANIEARAPTGDSPLTVAAYWHVPTILNTLINFGANLKHRNKSNMTAQDIITKLPGINLVTGKKDKQLFHCHVLLKIANIFTEFEQALIAKDDDLALAALNKLESPILDESFLGGKRLLTTAVTHGSFKSVATLLRRGANANTHTEGHATALQLAARNGLFQITKLLLSHKANPDIAEKTILSPIAQAIQNGHHDIVQELFKHGANGFIHVKIKTDSGQELELNLLEYTAFLGKDDAQMAKILIDHGINVTLRSLYRAIQFNQEDLSITLLAAKQIDINKHLPAEFEEAGATLLMLAIFRQERQIFTALAEAGANLHAFSVKHGTVEALAKANGFEQEFYKALSGQKTTSDDKKLDKSTHPKMMTDDTAQKDSEIIGGYSANISAGFYAAILFFSTAFLIYKTRRITQPLPLVEETEKKPKPKDTHKGNKDKPPQKEQLKSDPSPLPKSPAPAPIKFDWDDISSDLKRMRDDSVSKETIAHLDKEQEKSNNSIKLKYWQAIGISHAAKKEMETEALKFIEFRQRLAAIHKEAERLLLDKSPAVLEPYYALKIEFNSAMQNLPISGIDLKTTARTATNRYSKFYNDSQDAYPEEKSVPTPATPQKPEKTYQNTFRLTPTASEPEPPPAIPRERKRKRKKSTLSYSQKMQLVSELTTVFKEAGIGKDSVYMDKKSRILPHVIASGKAIPPKLALLFAMLLVAEAIKEPHFKEKTTARENLEHIRDRLGHAINEPLKKNLTEIVPAAVEFFEKVQQVAHEGFDETHLQTFESPLLNSLTVECVADEKSVISATLFNKFNEDFGVAWSKLDREDGSKSAKTVVYELAIRFLVANPAIRDITARYHSTTLAQDLRQLGNDWRHDDAIKCLQEVLVDFTPAVESRPGLISKSS